MGQIATPIGAPMWSSPEVLMEMPWNTERTSGRLVTEREVVNEDKEFTLRIMKID